MLAGRRALGWMTLLVFFLVFGCDDGGAGDPSDGDADGDVDGDADGDSDGDSDGDTYGGETPCVDDDDCAGDEHCLDEVCVDDVCEAELLFCDANQVMECDERGASGAFVEDCGSLSCQAGVCGCEEDDQCDAGEYCDDGACVLQQCAPSSRYCEDGDVIECDERGSGATVIEECGDLACEGGACVCDRDSQCEDDEYCASLVCVDDACPQGELYCDGSAVYQCNENGSDATLAEDCGALSCRVGGCYCESDAQCPADGHCSSGVCESDVCPQGTIYCVDDSVYQCDANGSAESEIQSCAPMVCRLGACTCTSDAHCESDQHCEGGACVPDVCLRGTIYCQDGDVYQCAADGGSESVIEDCGGFSCVDASCVCTNDAQCDAGEYCGAAGDCLPDVCEANSLFCSGGDVYQCDSSGSASMLSMACGAMACDSGECVCTSDGQCETTEFCASGDCLDDVCAQGELFCEGGDSYQCNTNGSASTLSQDCGSLVCDAGACICTESSQCGDGEHCTFGVCVDNFCPPSSTYCRDGDVWECDAEGAEETMVEECGSLVCEAGACVCTDSSHCAADEHCADADCVADVCPEGEAFCQDNDVYLCDDEGSSSSFVEFCGALTCDAGLCVCTSDDQCGALEICDGGLCVLDDATAGVHTSDLEISEVTGLSHIEVESVTVSEAGQIAAIASPTSSVAVQELSAHILHISADGTPSIFVHNDDMADYMGARYAHLDALTYTPAGDLIAADHAGTNFDVLRIDPTGAISTLITGEELVSALGVSGTSRIGYDIELAADGAENVYYWADGPKAVVRITPAGDATVLATLHGDADIRGLEVDSSGYVYAWDGDSDHRGIIWISSVGTVATWMSESAIEADVGSSVFFMDIDMDSAGNIWGYDYFEDRIIRVTSSRAASVQVGTTSIGEVASDPLWNDAAWYSTGLAVEPSGDVLVTFQYSDNLGRFETSPESGAVLSSNTSIVEVLGQGGADMQAVASTPGGTLYTWDEASRSLLRLDGSESIPLINLDDLRAANTAGGSIYGFNGYDIAVADDGVLYIVDDDVFSFDPATDIVTHVASDDAIELATGETHSDLRAVAVASSGEVYVFDAASDSVVAIDGAGVASVLHTFASSTTLVGGLELSDDETLLYVADRSTDSLVAIDTSTGATSTLVSEASLNAVAGTSFNPLSMAQLPDGDLIIFDGAGGLISLANTDRILHVDVLTGSVSIYLDQAEVRSARGVDEIAVLNSLAVDDSGTVYALDLMSDDILYWLP